MFVKVPRGAAGAGVGAGAADGGGGEAAETSGAAPYGAVQQARSTHRLFNGMCVSDFSAASVGAAMRAKLGYSLS